MTISPHLAVPAREMGDKEPCLYCGSMSSLIQSREGGHRISCGCVIDQPRAMGATRERKLDDIELDRRGIGDIKTYRRRQ